MTPPRPVTPGVADSSERVRVGLGIAGAVTFVLGCALVGIGGADREACTPLIGLGLAFYATSLRVPADGS